MGYDNIPDYDDNILVKHDLTIWATVIIISNILHCKFKNKNIFDSEWIIYSITSLFGLVIHSLITKEITLFIIKKNKIKDYNKKIAISDIVKYSTVYTLNNIILSYIYNKKINFHDKWLKLYGGIILGYVIFDLFIEKQIYKNSKKNKDFTISFFKAGLGIFMGYFISNDILHIDFIHVFASIQISLIFYYFLIKKFIPSYFL